MSSPGQGNSETRRLLTLRRSFYRFRISYNEHKRTILPTLLCLWNQEQPMGRVIPNQTINNLGYMNNWYSLKPQEDCLTTTFISSASHTTSAQVRRRFVCWNQEQPIVGLNPLQPSTTWDISETDFISSLKKFALRHPFYLILIIYAHNPADTLLSQPRTAHFNHSSIGGSGE